MAVMTVGSPALKAVLMVESSPSLSELLLAIRLAACWLLVSHHDVLVTLSRELAGSAGVSNLLLSAAIMPVMAGLATSTARSRNRSRSRRRFSG